MKLRCNLNQAEGLRYGILITSGLILLLRGHGFFLHSSFFAEDGKIWFADAYNYGAFRALVIPYSGYLSTAQRISAAIALVLPYRFAPLSMMLFGAACQFLPLVLLMSPRAETFGPLRLRALMAIAYVLMPNNQEVFIVTTDCMWHLVVALLILLGSMPPTGWPGWLADIGFTLVCSLSGPFSVLLFPLAWVVAFVRRQIWTKVLAGCLTLGAVVQLAVLVRQPVRIKVPLGASVHTFIGIVGRQLFIATILGSKATRSHFHFASLLLLSLIGFIIFAVCLWRASLAWRLFIISSFFIMAASLRWPLFPGDGRLSPWLWIENYGPQRYWYVPGLAFLWACIWCASYCRASAMRIVTSLFLFVCLIGVTGDWKVASPGNSSFKESVLELKDAKPGQILRIQIAPAGWQMILTKR